MIPLEQARIDIVETFDRLNMINAHTEIMALADRLKVLGESEKKSFKPVTGLSKWLYEIARSYPQRHDPWFYEHWIRSQLYPLVEAIRNRK